MPCTILSIPRNLEKSIFNFWTKSLAKMSKHELHSQKKSSSIPSKNAITHQLLVQASYFGVISSKSLKTTNALSSSLTLLMPISI